MPNVTPIEHTNSLLRCGAANWYDAGAKGVGSSWVFRFGTRPLATVPRAGQWRFRSMPIR